MDSNSHDNNPFDSLSQPDGSWVVLDDSGRYSPTHHLFFPNATSTDSSSDSSSGRSAASASNYNFANLNVNNSNNFNRGFAFTPGLALFAGGSSDDRVVAERLTPGYGLSLPSSSTNTSRSTTDKLPPKDAFNKYNSFNSEGERAMRMQEAERNFNNFNNINFNLNLGSSDKGRERPGDVNSRSHSPTASVDSSYRSHAADDEEELSIFDQLLNSNVYNYNGQPGNYNVNANVVRGATPPAKMYNGRTPPILGASPTVKLNVNIVKARTFEFEKEGTNARNVNQSDYSVMLEGYRLRKEQDRLLQAANDEKEKKKNKKPILKGSKKGKPSKNGLGAFNGGEDDFFQYFGVDGAWIIEQVKKFVPIFLLVGISYIVAIKARR